MLNRGPRLRPAVAVARPRMGYLLSVLEALERAARIAAPGLLEDRRAARASPAPRIPAPSTSTIRCRGLHSPARRCWKWPRTMPQQGVQFYTVDQTDAGKRHLLATDRLPLLPHLARHPRGAGRDRPQQHGGRRRQRDAPAGQLHREPPDAAHRALGRMVRHRPRLDAGLRAAWPSREHDRHVAPHVRPGHLLEPRAHRVDEPRA